jgi:hypothetical protein
MSALLVPAARSLGRGDRAAAAAAAAAPAARRPAAAAELVLLRAFKSHCFQAPSSRSRSAGAQATTARAAAPGAARGGGAPPAGDAEMWRNRLNSLAPSTRSVALEQLLRIEEEGAYAGLVSGAAAARPPPLLEPDDAGGGAGGGAPTAADGRADALSRTTPL